MPDKNISNIPEHDKIEGEEWRPVVGFEYTFAVSNYGRIIRTSDSRTRKVGMISKGVIWKGYRHVSLRRDGKDYKPSVHSIVLEAFIGPRPTQKHQANHKNGITLDNRVDNLEWVTASENRRHALKNGLRSVLHGEDHGMARLKHSEILEIRRLHKSLPPQKIADKFGISSHHVYLIASGRSWRHIPDTDVHIVRNWRLKLTPEQVASIRTEASLGTKQIVLANKYNVSPATVCNIVARKIWRQVP